MIIVYDNHIINFPYNPKNGLPMHKIKPGVQQYASFCAQINQTLSDLHPAPFFVHAYNAYTISQDTQDSMQPPKNEPQSPPSPKQPIPPTDTNLSKTQHDLL